MARRTLFKRTANKASPNNTASNKNKSRMIDNWMANDHKQDAQDTVVDLPIIDDDFLDQEKTVVAKDPRIETGLLKSRIAEKIKDLNKNT